MNNKITHRLQQTHTTTTFALLLSVFIMYVSCSSSRQGLFTKKTAHEKYKAGLTVSGLNQTLLGRTWINAAEKSLQSPLTVMLPYEETGYFPQDKPAATGLLFSAKRGEKLVISLTRQPVIAVVFAEIWLQETAGKKLLAAPDSVSREWIFEIEKDGQYQLRLQPELLQAVSYRLSINTAPSLHFPVRAADNPKATSFWGAERDGGVRRHEGMDIFAKKGTPALAAADGSVTRVGENELGGKVVFFRPNGRDYTLYYAHLDTQWVKEGQALKVGEEIGAIGNTGNARTTAPHLHFGIYTSNGAIDPFPFINTNRPSPAATLIDTASLDQAKRTNTANVFYANLLPGTRPLPLDKNCIVRVKSITGSWCHIELPDGKEGFVKSNFLTSDIVQTKKMHTAGYLLAQPDSLSAILMELKIGEILRVRGNWKDFVFVIHPSGSGWVKKELL